MGNSKVEKGWLIARKGKVEKVRNKGKKEGQRRRRMRRKGWVRSPVIKYCGEWELQEVGRLEDEDRMEKGGEGGKEGEWEEEGTKKGMEAATAISHPHPICSLLPVSSSTQTINPTATSEPPPPSCLMVCPPCLPATSLYV